MQVDNERSLQAIERLEALYEVLKKYGTEKYVSFDLGLLNQYNYYTGVIFKGIYLWCRRCHRDRWTL